MIKITQFIKAFLIGFTGLFIVITLFSLLIPSRVRVSRATIIYDVTKANVLQQTAHVENWTNWHPVFKGDSAKLTCPDTSNITIKTCNIFHNGRVTQLSVTAVDTSSIKFDLRATGENNISNELVFTSLPEQHSVQVEWRAITKLKWYPWEKVYGIFIDKLTGSSYEQALDGLKNFLEKKAVKLQTVPPLTFKICNK